jgi:hypothetical protein
MRARKKEGGGGGEKGRRKEEEEEEKEEEGDEFRRRRRRRGGGARSGLVGSLPTSARELQHVPPARVDGFEGPKPAVSRVVGRELELRFDLVLRREGNSDG